MLRDIKSPFLRPRLIPFTVTKSTAYSLACGTGSVTPVAGSTGVTNLDFSTAFARTQISVVTAMSSDVASGGYAVTNMGTASRIQVGTFAPAGTGDDGSFSGFTLGYDSPETQRCMRRANSVRSYNDAQRIEAFQVNTASEILIGKGRATLTINGTGDVTITLKQAFSSSAVSATATPVSATGAVCMIHSISASAIRVKCFTTAGVAADKTFNIIIVGSDSISTTRGSGSIVRTSQRKPVLFGYRIAYSSGVPDYSINSGDATLTDAGTGESAFVFRQAFRREPVIVASTIAGAGTTRYSTITGSTSAGFTVLQFDSTPSAADPADNAGFSVVGIGFDDPSEY